MWPIIATGTARLSHMCETGLSLENQITTDHSIGFDRPFA
ncbi:hypothetical protein RISK_004787 [Rhodopirellula islandica]|uniref:Uncharacterized protein n=1 Tax=Rhodopirellula islandica TaxID=595434 RepID=A0A0J1B9E7_RHOIS|nr:hypothetical protein RISK_004787 [Rhodopirellula islandica]